MTSVSLGVLIFVVTVALVEYGFVDAITREECKTSGCMKTVYYFGKTFAWNSEACSDFYHFACADYRYESISEERPENYDHTAKSLAHQLNNLMFGSGVDCKWPQCTTRDEDMIAARYEASCSEQDESSKDSLKHFVDILNEASKIEKWTDMENWAVSRGLRSSFFKTYTAGHHGVRYYEFIADPPTYYMQLHQPAISNPDAVIIDLRPDVTDYSPSDEGRITTYIHLLREANLSQELVVKLHDGFQISRQLDRKLTEEHKKTNQDDHGLNFFVNDTRETSVKTVLRFIGNICGTVALNSCLLMENPFAKLPAHKRLMIVILGFARGDNNSMECPTFSCPGLSKSDLKFNYLLEDQDMVTDPYGRVCDADASLMPVPWSEETWNHYKQSEYLFNLREIDLLSSEKYAAWTSPGFKSARHFYSHCMNLDSETEEDDFKSKSILNDTILLNPIARKPLNYDTPLEYDPLEKDIWIKLDNYYVKNFGLSTFHHITKTVNRTENKQILVLATPKFFIPQRVLLSLGPEAIRKELLQTTTQIRSPKRQAYVDYIHEALQDISSIYERNRFVESEERQIDRIEDLINFEVNLAKIAQPDRNEIYTEGITGLPTFDTWQVWYNQQWMYHDVSIDVEWKKSPILYLARGLISEHSPCMIDWTKRVHSLVRSTLSSEESSITDVELNKARVHIKNGVYHLKLCALLNTTNLNLVMDYIHWNNYRNGLVRTKKGFRKFLALAEKMEFDHDIKESRSLYCTKTNVLKTPVHWAMANDAKAYIASTKEKIRTIYKNVLMSLLNKNIDKFLAANSWVSNKKFKNDFFSMPINIFGDESLLASSQDFDTDIPDVPETSTYFGWYIEQQKWQVKNTLRVINEPCSKTSWPVQVNRPLVFVTKTEKSYELFLTAAILQPPFFEPNQNDMLNYAGIGVEIAMVMWNLAYFPVINDEVVMKQTNYVQKNCSSLMRPNMSTEQYNEFFKNLYRNIDPVEIALDAYAQAGNLDDNGKFGQILQSTQKKAFVTAHIRTQCERFRSNGTKPDADRNKIRDAGVYYPFRDFSGSKYRIDALGMSRFFVKTFRGVSGCNL